MGNKDRVITGIFRMLTFPICIALAIYVVPLFDDLRKYPLPLDIPNRHEIYTGQGLTAAFGVIAALWLPLSVAFNGLTSQKRYGYWFILYSLIDIVIVGGLLDSLIQTASYLPSSAAGCQEAKTWQVVGNASFFHCIDNTYGWSGTDDGSNWYSPPETTCRSLLIARILTIVIAIVTALTAYTPISRSRIPWFLVWVFGHITRFLKVVLIFTGWAGKKSQANIIEPRNATENSFELKQKSRMKATTLDALLTCDDSARIILLIAEKLHYSDIVSMSLASKSMYRAIYPPSMRNDRVELLGIAACQPGTKSECWCCGTEICDGCTQFMNLMESASTTHIDHCKPYCSTCYYKGPCRRYVSGREKPDQYKTMCACVGRTSNVPYYQTGLLSDALTKRSVCRHCSSLDAKAALAVRESREKAEIKHLARQQWRCAICTRALRQGGPRWWGCSLCQKECLSDFHPIWVKSKKEL